MINDTATDLRVTVTRLRRLLKQYEWAYGQGSFQWPVCQECCSSKQDGHSDGCKRAAEIALLDVSGTAGTVEATSIAGDEERSEGVTFVTCDTNDMHRGKTHAQNPLCQNPRPAKTESLEGVAVACRYPSLSHAGRHIRSEQCVKPEALDTFAVVTGHDERTTDPASQIYSANTSTDTAINPSGKTPAEHLRCDAPCGCVSVATNGDRLQLDYGRCNYGELVKPNAEICGVVWYEGWEREPNRKLFIVCLGDPGHQHTDEDMTNGVNREAFVPVPELLIDQSGPKAYRLKATL